MDNQITTGNEQVGGGQADVIIDSGNIQDTPPVTEEKQISNIPEINETLAKEAELEKPKEPESPQKIKVGEKEYTYEELTQLIEKTEIPKKEEQQEPTFREPAQIDAEIETINKKAASDYTSLFERFLNRAQDKQSAYNALVASAEKRDYTEFIKHLSPTDVQEFLFGLSEVDKRYNDPIGKLTEEKQKAETETQFKQNLNKWDTFINENIKDNPAAQHFFNYGKSTAYFDEAHAKEALQKFNEAVALAVNAKEMSQQAKDIKQAMYDGTPAPAPTQKIFTREDIRKMSLAEFQKNEQAIFDQEAKGLIK